MEETLGESLCRPHPIHLYCVIQLAICSHHGTLYRSPSYTRLITNKQSSCFISDGESRSLQSVLIMSYIRRGTEEAVVGGCLWSESTFIFHFNIKNGRKGIFEFSMHGKMHIDLTLSFVSLTVWSQIGYLRSNKDYKQIM